MFSISDALHCRGHDGSITHVGFSRDKNMVISSSKDGTARIWRNNPNPDPLVPSSAFEFQSAVIFSHMLHPPSQSQVLKAGSAQSVMKSSQAGGKPTGIDNIILFAYCSSFYFY